MAREFSRAMEQAANESGGANEVRKDLNALKRPLSGGIDSLKSAADRFEKWDPVKAATKSCDDASDGACHGARGRGAGCGGRRRAGGATAPTGTAAETPAQTPASTPAGNPMGPGNRAGGAESREARRRRGQGGPPARRRQGQEPDPDPRGPCRRLCRAG